MISHHELRLFAHRGASAHLPENTLPAFERALADGADVLELDVHRLRDGTPVVSHDPDGRRTAHMARTLSEVEPWELAHWDAGLAFVAPDGSRPFANQGIHPPTLEAVLERFPAARVNVDLKPADPLLVRRTVELVQKAGAENRVTLGSVHADNVRLARRLGPRIATALTAPEASLLRFLPRLASRLVPLSGQAAQVPRHLGPIEIPTRRFVAHAHARGLRVDVWLVNDPEVARRLLEHGVDGLVTDDPALLAPVCAEFRARRDSASGDRVPLRLGG